MKQRSSSRWEGRTLGGMFVLLSFSLSVIHPAAASASTDVVARAPRTSASAPTLSAPAVSPAAPATGTIVARDGQFWLGTERILFHGIGLNSPTADYLDKLQSFNMNMVRTGSEWAQLEPNPPVKQGDGTWKHTYDMNYMNTIISQVKMASSRGIWTLMNNGVCRDADNDNKPSCSPVGWPHWLYQAAYNSHGVNYNVGAEDGQAQALTDFWTDELQKQFMADQWAFVAGQLKGVQGVLGYEIMNEPHRGYYLSETRTSQMILDTLVRFGQGIRKADPNRVLVFATRTGMLPGLPNVDLSGVAALGNASFDLHNYFGARWGGGLAQGVNNANEVKQNQYNSVLSGVPYFGTTYGQIRFLQTYLNVLRPYGFPLVVGEFGDANNDPGIMNYFGTTTAAFNQLGVSWNIHNNMYATGSPLDWSILYQDGRETPWLTQIIKPAAAYQG